MKTCFRGHVKTLTGFCSVCARARHAANRCRRWASGDGDPRLNKATEVLRVEFDQLFGELDEFLRPFVPGTQSTMVSIDREGRPRCTVHASTWRAWERRGWVVFDRRDGKDEFWRIER